MKSLRPHPSALGRTCLLHTAKGDTCFVLLASRRNAKPAPLVQVLSDFDRIEPQQTAHIHMRQARAAEVVNMPHGAAQERRHFINSPKVLGGGGCVSGDFHAYSAASTSTDRQRVECRVNPTNTAPT
jgi:hypothetical protein